MKDGTRLYTGSHGDELGSHNNVQQAASFTTLKGTVCENTKRLQLSVSYWYEG
jgi:hypothetical protein